MQIRYINRALQRFDSTQVIPTQFVLFTLSVIIGSAVLYRDFESMSASRAGKFVGGCALTFLGVYFITSGRVRSDDESAFSTEDEEEAIGLLHGERYRDRIDLSPPAPRYRPPKTLPIDREEEDAVLSPAGSLTSRGIDGIDDDQFTPRGANSGAPSSPAGSLTAESPLSGPSRDYASPLRPPSRMSNPWAKSPLRPDRRSPFRRALQSRQELLPLQTIDLSWDTPFKSLAPPSSLSQWAKHLLATKADR